MEPDSVYVWWSEIRRSIDEDVHIRRSDRWTGVGMFASGNYQCVRFAIRRN